MRFALVLVVLFVALASPALVPLAEAKGPPTKVTIEGPGLPRAIEIVDRDALDALAPGVLERTRDPIRDTRPDPTLPVYQITRHWGHEVGDRLRYVPSPEGAGWLQAEGVQFAYAPPSHFVAGGRWWRPQPATEQVIQELLAHPPPPSPAESTGLPWTNLLSWGAVLAVLAGGLVVIREIRRSR